MGEEGWYTTILDPHLPYSRIHTRGKLNSTAQKLDLAPEADKQKYWQPEVWSPRHALVARMHGAGLSNEEIALATGFTEGYVSRIICDDRAKPFAIEAVGRVADMAADLNTRLKLHATEALDEIVSTLRNPLVKPELRVKVGFGLLDRAGYTPVQRHTIVAPTELPPDLAGAVLETTTEMKTIRQNVRYTAPIPEEKSEEGVDISKLVEGAG